MKVFADKNCLQRDTWNIGYGNKIQHLFFLLRLADQMGVQPVVPCDTPLDEIFDLSKIKIEVAEGDLENCIYTETTAFPPIDYFHKIMNKIGISVFTKNNLYRTVERSNRQARDEALFLESASGSSMKGYVRGHFWHYDLMPSMEVFHRYISVKADLISAVKAKYPDIEADESVVVHLRETDFRNHLRHVFNKSIVLPASYYQKAIERAESSLNRPLTYHLFSDNQEKIKQIFKGRKYVLHNDNAAMDWVSLFLGKYVIQSNSSFCWTASLYNKAFSIQPSGGYNWASPETGSVPYGFKMPFSEEIIC